MNFIKMSYSLFECLHSYSISSPKQLRYLAKRSYKGDLNLIVKKIKKQLRDEFSYDIFKSLILFHYLCRNGSPQIFNEVEQISYYNKNAPTKVFQPDNSKFSYWAESYSTVLQQSLTFHRKYQIFTGRYKIPRGETLPENFQNVDIIAQMETELFTMFKAYTDYIGAFFEKQTNNKILQQSIELAVQEVMDLYSTLNDIANYKAMLLQRRIDTSNLHFCKQEIEHIKKTLETPLLSIPKIKDIPPINHIKLGTSESKIFMMSYPLPLSLQNEVTSPLPTKHKKHHGSHKEKRPRSKGTPLINLDCAILLD
ncbi:hypothetical protein EIN_185120 [Entamoeba invadens IP1]|uniref:AP180 N-terminal homology (ANTH) domain-containing protein n=1 Tax=Entamoeba invadens TaxID=33085 RepID=S0B197_ENTIV|nr:hypothetical protein EIN_185120 [Entamoeba invadens IP1]ELP94135.1 hypothetical protein EIN_185120 [Entamoeba invadens IP1]BAN41550.1 hypothetical protein [Entamoeba invadens]|eukprot:XP_004260906.1 hypothetical protein EIN_185120 [Entamoeba invadens IP1]